MIMLGLLDHLFNLLPGCLDYAGGWQDGLLRGVLDQSRELVTECIWLDVPGARSVGEGEAQRAWRELSLRVEQR